MYGFCFPLYHFNSLIPVSWIHGLVCSHFTSNGKFCLMAWQQAGYPYALLKEAHSSSISLHLIKFMIQLMVGVPRVTDTWDPKLVESGMTRAT